MWNGRVWRADSKLRRCAGRARSSGRCRCALPASIRRLDAAVTAGERMGRHAVAQAGQCDGCAAAQADGRGGIVVDQRWQGATIGQRRLGATAEQVVQQLRALARAVSERGIVHAAAPATAAAPSRSPASRPWRSLVRHPGLRPRLAIDLQRLHRRRSRVSCWPRSRSAPHRPAVPPSHVRTPVNRSRTPGAHAQRIQAQRSQHVPRGGLAVVLVARIALADLAAHSRDRISRTCCWVFHGCPAYRYIHGMWCAGWLLCAYMPMRTSRASVISWMVPP